MTAGLPKPVTDLYNKADVPSGLEKKLFKIYSHYLRLYVKAWTWYNYDRKNSASLRPFKLLKVDTGDINLYSRRGQIGFLDNVIYPQVQEGDWDRNHIEKVENREKFKAFKQHFVDGIDWKDTFHYQDMKSDIEKDRSRYFCTNIEELNQYFGNIDVLYRDIKNNGYLKQSEIQDKADTVNNEQLVDHYLDEINEITVNIGRNGKLLFEEGRHRFYIAKILGLEEIPVRILVRHKKWQEKRNKAVKNPEKLSEEEKKHPDIQYLVT